MKKQDIVIGKVYVMKVSGFLRPVRVEATCTYGGWSGTNLDTGRTVRIKTAAKLRKEWPNQAVASTDSPDEDLGAKYRRESAHPSGIRVAGYGGTVKENPVEIATPRIE